MFSPPLVQLPKNEMPDLLGHLFFIDLGQKYLMNFLGVQKFGYDVLICNLFEGHHRKQETQKQGPEFWCLTM